MAKSKDEAAEVQAVEPAGTLGAALTEATADITGKNIDERMADLAADHKRMGARPDPSRWNKRPEEGREPQP